MTVRGLWSTQMGGCLTWTRQHSGAPSKGPARIRLSVISFERVEERTLWIRWTIWSGRPRDVAPAPEPGVKTRGQGIEIGNDSNLLIESGGEKVELQCHRAESGGARQIWRNDCAIRSREIDYRVVSDVGGSQQTEDSRRLSTLAQGLGPWVRMGSKPLVILEWGRSCAL
nr:hypothetical protein Iba_chr09bCG4790 [Ipomoea batatas]